MRRQSQASPDLITKVNVTPIIDVALVLVIILLVTAPMISAVDMRIQLPEARTKSAEGERNLSISVSPQGELTVDRDKVTRAGLPKALRTRLARPGGENVLVVVCADAGLPYEKVSWVLEQARDAGAKRLAIATRQKPEKPR